MDVFKTNQKSEDNNKIEEDDQDDFGDFGDFNEGE